MPTAINTRAEHVVLDGLVANAFVSTTSRAAARIPPLPCGPILIDKNALSRARGVGDVISGTGSPSSWLTCTGNVAITDLARSPWDARALGIYPCDASLLIGGGGPGRLPTVDYNLTDRGGAAMAYAYAWSPAGNPGRPPAAGLRSQR